MIQAKYHEDDDDDEDGEAMAMASVSIATTPRVSLLDSPNKNITAKCHMAKATKKVTPNIKTTIITNPSLTDCIDEHEGLITHKCRESQQLSRVKYSTQFIDSTQGEPKNIIEY